MEGTQSEAAPSRRLIATGRRHIVNGRPIFEQRITDVAVWSVEEGEHLRGRANACTLTMFTAQGVREGSSCVRHTTASSPSSQDTLETLLTTLESGETSTDLSERG